MRRRRTIEIAADWTALTLNIGDVIAIAGEPGRWLVEASEWEDMAVRLRLRAFEMGSRPIVTTGASGDLVRQPDLMEGATSLAIVELPGDGSTAATAPMVMVAATGAERGWRRAALFRYNGELEIAEPIGTTALPAILGASVGALGAADTSRFDLRNVVEIQLDDPSDVLTSAPDDLLIAGANLCLLGDELLQFGHVERVSPGRYRLSRLIRGRSGTEWATSGHSNGDRFVLLEANRLRPMSLGPEDVGTTITIRAIGSGDVEPAEAQRLIDGRAMLPLAPVHGRILIHANGDCEISWIRRSRLGWAWIDGTDVPLSEEQEAYEVRIMAGVRELRRWETQAPMALYSEADRMADLLTASSDSIGIEIRQRGSWGLGRALVIAAL